jgi:hypothetical protein
MVLATIDEQFKKLILLDDEHDLILFKPVEWKQMHRCTYFEHLIVQIQKSSKRF